MWKQTIKLGLATRAATSTARKRGGKGKQMNGDILRTLSCVFLSSSIPIENPVYTCKCMLSCIAQSCSTWPAPQHLPDSRSLPLSGMRERTGGKGRKAAGWDEANLISEAKLHMQARQNKEFIHCFPPVGWSLAAPCKAGGPLCMWQLLGKINATSTRDCPSSSFPWGFVAEPWHRSGNG